MESARFAGAALAGVGAAVELAIGAVVTALFAMVLPCGPEVGAAVEAIKVE